MAEIQENQSIDEEIGNSKVGGPNNKRVLYNRRIALALIIMNKLKPLQVDVSTAYLHAKLDDEVYMEAIPGYPLPPGKVYRLLKALYGLPQSGRIWNKTFERFIKSLGFVNIREDVCIFILAREGRVVAILALYVDDFLIGTDSDDTEAWLIKEITKVFKLTQQPIYSIPLYSTIDSY